MAHAFFQRYGALVGSSLLLAVLLSGNLFAGQAFAQKHPSEPHPSKSYNDQWGAMSLTVPPIPLPPEHGYSHLWIVHTSPFYRSDSRLGPHAP